MFISFNYFQLLLVIAMISGLFLLLLPIFRIVKLARLPLTSVLLVLVPLINAAWVLFLATRLNFAVGSYEKV